MLSEMQNLSRKKFYLEQTFPFMLFGLSAPSCMLSSTSLVVLSKNSVFLFQVPTLEKVSFSLCMYFKVTHMKVNKDG